MKSASRASKCSTVMALLLSHQTTRSVFASRTTNLSLGLRPVCDAGVGDERPMRGDLRFVALQRLLVELRRAEVPMHGGKIAEAELVPRRSRRCAPRSRSSCASLAERAWTIKRAPPPFYANLAPRGQAGEARINRNGTPSR